MAQPSEMTSADLTNLLRLLDEASIEVWLDGGWGVDALLETQTREHKDADVIVRVSDVPGLRQILGQKGFVIKKGSSPTHSFSLMIRAGKSMYTQLCLMSAGMGYTGWKTERTGSIRRRGLAGGVLSTALSYNVSRRRHRCCAMLTGIRRLKKTSGIWSFSTNDLELSCLRN